HDQLAHDGEPKTGAAAGAIARIVPPVESLENMGEALRGDTFAGIFDRDLDPAIPSLRSDCDETALRGVPERVADKIAENLYYALPIGPRQWKIRRHRCDDGNLALAPSERRNCVGNFAHDVAKPDRLEVERQCSGLHRRKREEVVDQAAEIIAFPFDDRQIA